jgi:hypothetical protein
VEAETTLRPQLLLSPFFWGHWANNIGAVMSFPVVTAALVGTALLKQRTSRALMLGAWVGYVLFCLTANYNLAAHDYYQLQLIPIAALGLAPLAALGPRLVARHKSAAVLRWAAWTALTVVVAVAMVRSGSRLGTTNQEAQVAERIGAQVQHSTRTLYLAADYGVPLEYYGRLSGRAWPIASDLEWEQLAGVQQLSAEQRFQAWFAGDKPEYFIVLDLTELDNQPDLKDFLIRNFVLVTRAPEYWLFDLRQV